MTDATGLGARLKAARKEHRWTLRQAEVTEWMAAHGIEVYRMWQG